MDGTQDKPTDGEKQNVTERVSRKDEGNADSNFSKTQLLNMLANPTRTQLLYKRCNYHIYSNKLMEVSFHIYQLHYKQVYVQRF